MSSLRGTKQTKAIQSNPALRGKNTSKLNEYRYQNQTALDTINKYNELMNNGGWMSSDDLAKYNSAINTYKTTGTALRDASKFYGTKYTEDEEKSWLDSLTSLSNSYTSANELYSSFADADQFTNWWNYNTGKNKYHSVTGAEDYLQNSQYVKGGQDSRYDFINQGKGYSVPIAGMGADDLVAGFTSWLPDPARDAIGSALGYSEPLPDVDYSEFISDFFTGLVKETPNAATYTNNGDLELTDEEIGVYNYYYATQGKEKADEYLKYIEEEVRQRKAGIDYANFKAADNLMDALLKVDTGNLGEYAYGFGAGVESGLAGFANVGALVNGTEGYTPASQYVSSMIRNDLGEEGKKLTLEQVFYDLANTTGNMAPSMVVGGFAGPAAGAIAMGLSSAGNNYTSFLKEGYGVNAARAYGIITGISEAGMSYLFSGIGKLGGKVTSKLAGNIAAGLNNAAARIAVDFAKSFVGEAFEEAAQSALEPVFKWAATLGEAELEAINWEEVGYSALLGGLSGGMLEGAPSLVKTAVQSHAAYTDAGGSTIGGVVDALINPDVDFTEYVTQNAQNVTDTAVDYANELESIDPGNKAAQYVLKKAEAGKNISGYQVNRLANEINSTNQEAVKSAVKTRLVELGEGAMAGKVADVITKVQLGQAITSAEEAILNTSKNAYLVLTESDVGNIKGGGLANKWAESILKNLDSKNGGKKVKTPIAVRPEDEETKPVNAENSGKRVEAVETIAADKLAGNKINQEASEAMVKGYDGKVSASEYSKLYQAAYDAGASGEAQSSLSKLINRGLSQRAAFTAYDIGKNSVLKSDAEGGIINTESAEAKNESGEGVHLRGSVQRNNGENTEGQLSRVEKDSGKTEGRRNRSRGPADGEAARLVNEGREVSVADLGIPGGVKDQKVYRLEDVEETASMKKARKAAEKRGLVVRFFAGDNLMIETKDGTIENVRGYIQGKYVYIRADHPYYTADQIMRHELGHDMVSKGEVAVSKVIERLKKLVGEENVKAVAEFYAKAYAGTGLTVDEVWEEVICDSLGDMNIFSGDEAISKFIAPMLKDIKKATYDTKSKANQTRGAPEGKASRDTEDLYTLTDEFLQEVPAGTRGAFARSLANKTTGMIEGETRTVYVCGYIFEADGYMHGHIIAEYDNETKKLLEEKRSRYDGINKDGEIAAVWSEAVRNAERGSISNSGISRRGRSGADDRFLDKSSERDTSRDNERVWPTPKTKEEINEIVNKVREMYGLPIVDYSKQGKASRELDSLGNELSPAVQKRFEKSTVVDENGRLKVVYHGTTSGEFYTFDKSKGSVEGDFGSGFYFTDNLDDVSNNYEGGGPDFENKVWRRAEQIFDEDPDIQMDEAKDKARAELYKGSNKFEVYLNVENPAIVGETILFAPESYAENYNEEDYDNYDDYIGDVEQLLADDIDSIIWDIENSIDLYGSTDGIRNVLIEAYYEGGIDIEKLKSKINELYLESTDGEIVGNEVTRQIIESLGYDGIVDSTVSSKFKNMGMEADTTHYIVFKPNQIKAVTNQNPTDNPDIRYSRELDTEYLSAVNRGDMEAAQRMVDEAAKKAGYIVKAYHGTSRGDRVGNVFLPERATSGPMAFFTDNRVIAEGYSKGKQDTSMAYDPDFDRYETQFRIKTKYNDMPLYKAWGYLPFDARNRITKKAGQLRENWDGDGELILDPTTNEAGGGFQWQLKESRGNAIQALTEQWLNSGNLFNEEVRFLDVLEMAGVTEEFKKIGMDSLYFKDPHARHEKVYDTFLKINNPLDTSLVDEKFVTELEAWYEEQDQSKYERESVSADLWDKNSIDAYDFAQRVRDDIERGTFHAWTSIPDSVTNYLKHMGYDGIKDVGGKNGGEGHTVWIPFSSEQVKSAEPVVYDDSKNVIPLSERFNPENKDIRFSRELDLIDYINEQAGKESDDSLTKSQKVAQVRSELERMNVDKGSLMALTKVGDKLFDLYGGESSISEFRYGMLEATKLALDGSETGFDKAYEIVQTLAREVAYNPKDAGGEAELLREIKAEIRGSKMAVHEKDKTSGEFDKYGGYGAFRRNHIGKFMLANDGIQVDAKYAELRNQYGEAFFPDVNTVSEQLMQMAKLMDTPLSDYMMVSEADLEASADGMVGSLFDKLGNIWNKAIKEKPVVKVNNATLSNRELLANALETTVKHEVEAKKIAEYKGHINELNQQTLKLFEMRKEIKELTFGKGEKNPQRLAELKEEARKTENRIHFHDRKLLQLESTTALKGVVERERQHAYKAAAEKGREALKRNVEGRHKSEARAKIKRLKEKFMSMLEHPTERQYVPSDLVSAMVKVCEMIDTSSSLLKSDGSINKAQQARNEQMQRLINLAAEYKKIKNNPDAMIAEEYEAEIADYLDEIVANYASKNIADMTLDELTELYRTMKAIEETLRDARKLIGWTEAESVYDAGDSIIAEQRELAKTRKENLVSKADDIVVNMSLAPMRAVLRMAGYNEDSALYRAFREIEKGVREQKKFVMDAVKKFEALTTGKNADVYEKAIYDPYGKELVDKNGKKFYVTKMQMMQAIMSYEREMANDKLHHVSNGGFTFADIDLLGKGEIREAVSAKNAHTVTLGAELALKFQMELANDQWAQDYMAEARKFFDETAKDAINEANMKLKHRIIATGKNYIPYEVNSDYIVREITSENDIQQVISGYGMLKDLKAGATQPIIITGLNNVLDRHIEQVGNVAALAVPIRNFNKIWNVKSEDGSTTVREAIKANWGTGGEDLITQAVKDVQGSRKQDNSPAYKLYKIVKSNLIGATFLGNVSVVLKQIGSMFSATSMLNWRDPVSMIGNLFVTKANRDAIAAEVNQYTAVAWVRGQGLSDAELYELKTAGKKSKLGRAINKLPSSLNMAKWITQMDYDVALSLWKYAKEDVAKRTGLEGEELLEATAEYYNDVIENTQSMSDALHRPEIQKSDNVMSETLGIFKTDLYQNAGMLRVAFEGRKANPSKETNRALVKALGGVLGSMCWGSLITSLMAALRYKPDRYRDDEDDEITAESWLKVAGGDMVEEMFGYMFPLFGGEAAGIIRAFITGEDYEFDNMTLNSVNDLLKAISSVTTTFNEEDFISEKAGRAWKNLLVKVAAVFGVPANNAVRFIEAVKKHAQDIANGEFLSFEAGLTSKNPTRLYNAYFEGDPDKIEKASRLYEDEKAVNEALRQQLREKDPRMQQIAQCELLGDTKRSVALEKEIVAEGHFDKDEVVGKAIDSEINFVKNKIKEAKAYADEGKTAEAEAIYKALIKRGYTQAFIDAYLKKIN